MALLMLGVAMWSVAHLWRRLAPAHRERFGQRGKGLAAMAILASILLMIFGYREAQATAWWAATPMLKGVNNLMVLVGFYLFAASGAKTALGRRLGHPMLIGFALWAGAHVLVNGDAPSFVLFGGLLAWALATMIVINRAEPVWRPDPAPINWSKEVGVALVAVIAYGAVGWAHGMVGPRPWGA